MLIQMNVIKLQLIIDVEQLDRLEVIELPHYMTLQKANYRMIQW